MAIYAWREVVFDLLLPSPGAGLFAAAAAAALALAVWARRRSAATRVSTGHAALALILASIGAVPLWRLATGVPSPFSDFTMTSAAHTWIVALALAYYPATRFAPEVDRAGIRSLALAAAMTIAVSVFVLPTSGGAQWSPRYLAHVAPLIAVIAVAPLYGAGSLPDPLRFQVRAAVSSVLLLAVLLQMEGLAAAVRTRRINGALRQQIAALVPSGGVVITPVGWVPQLLATDLESRRIFLTDRREGIREILARARARQIDAVWVVNAPGQIAFDDTPFEGCAPREDRRLVRGLVLRRYACAN